jgi:hypothetical protein
MIIDIPTKEDFYSSADDMVNEAWEKISNLAHEYYELDSKNQFYLSSEYFTDEDVYGLDQYWHHARPKLISALTLVLQSVEFKLKGLIADISPYLLITGSTKNIPKADENGIRSFTQFHSIDAQDLIKVYEVFGDKQISPKFKKWYEDIRILRNKFMHTVDKSSDINPEIIFKGIVYAHNELNQGGSNWIWHRYRYKASHSGGGVDFNKDEISGDIFEMLQVHYELTGAIYSCSREVANEIFNYDKSVDSDYCKKCVSVMAEFEYFDSKHIDYCLGTVQRNKRSGMYQCIFCRNEYEKLPESIWEDD